MPTMSSKKDSEGLANDSALVGGGEGRRDPQPTITIKPKETKEKSLLDLLENDLCTLPFP